jgi:hypothetical protein
MHAYTNLVTCLQQYVPLGVMESVSPDKPGGTFAVFSASDNNGVDDTTVDDTDGVPEDEELGGAAPCQWGPRSRR